MDLPIASLLIRGRIEQITLDRDLRITAFSGAAARLAESPASVVPGEDIRLGFPELVGAEEDLRDVLSGQRLSWSLRGVCRSDRPDALMYLDLSAEARRVMGQEHPVLVLVVEDVTLWMTEFQKRTQGTNDAMLLTQALAASKDHLQEILNAMSEMLVAVSSHGAITAVNHATLVMTGYTSPELIGRPISDLVPEAKSNASLAGRRSTSAIELRCMTKEGIGIPVSFSLTPLNAGGDAEDGTVYIGRDLRESRRAEARITNLETANLSLRAILEEGSGVGEIVWASAAMDALMRDLEKVAATDTTVLITGETGTGKELIARALHGLSRRKAKPMITVNCAGLPSGLVESEMFGHEKGAFTGALMKRLGRFELADGGTIFLDEVGELPAATQATLLRVLQGRSFERVGGSQTVSVDVRVIAATNRDLNEATREGRFREDLLFRLNVFPLRVPALRDRSGDVPLLVDHFAGICFRRANKPAVPFSAQAMAALERYHWPGNVRELANVIERAIIVCEGHRVDLGDLAFGGSTRGRSGAPGSLDEVARQVILQTLEECDGVVEGPTGAAEKLGLNPATLRSRLRKLGIFRTGGGFVRRSTDG